MSEFNLTIETVFLVNSFNRKNLLTKAISSLIYYCSTNLKTATLVYEVGSTDGSREFLDNLKSKYVYLITSSEPMSFSDGCNYAVLKASTFFPKIKQFILFETDNFLRNQIPINQALYLLQTKPNVGAVGFTVQKYDGTFLIPGSTFIKVIVTILGLTFSDKFKFERMNLNNWQKENGFKWHFYDVLYTSPLVIRHEAWKRTEGMDSVNFPFSESDTDWGYRLFQEGYASAIIECEGIIHDNLATKSEWSDKRVLDVHKGRLNYIFKHKGKLVANAIKPLLCLRHIAEWIFFSLQNREKSKIKIRKKMVFSVWCNYQ